MIEEEEKTKKPDEKKQTISESKPENEKAPKEDEKKPTLNETDEKKQNTKTPGKHMRKPECDNKCNPENNKENEKKAQ